jgi:hypothetical protein
VAYQDGYQGPATVQECISGSWQPVGKSDFSAGGTDNNAFYLYNGTPYVAYTDYTDNGKATVMMFDGANWVDVGAADFSAWSATSISLYVYDNNGTAVPYVAYSDWSQPHYNVTVEKYTGANWVDVGNAGFSKGAANCTSLAVDNNGTPYVAYDDEANSEDNGNGPATVMKLDGSTWVNVGTADFSGTDPDQSDCNDTLYESLAIDNNGTPYVAYQDGTNGPATVAEYTDAGTTGWQLLGGRGFTSGHNFGISNGFAAVYESLYISNGTPYLAYNGYNVNGTASDSINVVEYNSVSSSWQDVGSTAPDSGAYISLYVSNGTPYVAFKDGTDGHKATVIEDVVPQTPTPIITTPVYAGATSVSGTSVASASIVLTVGSETAQPAVTANGSGDWTVNGLTLTSGEVISVTAQALGDAVSNPATATVAAAPAQNSTINPTTATFDLNVSDSVYYADVPVSVTLNGNTLTDITNGATTLTLDTDYTASVSDSVYTVTILKSYLATQSVGTTDLTFDFSAGASATLDVTVENTTPALPPPSPPTISPNGGSITTSQTVTIDANLTVGQAVYYTTNGSTLFVTAAPTVSSCVYYSTPFSLSAGSSITVNAAVYDSGSGLWSSVTSATFTVATPVVSTSGSGTVSNTTGGTVSLGSEASVTIPASALGSASATVTVQSASSPPAAPTGYTVVGAYEFTVNGGGYTFNSPVTLTFTFPSGTTNPAVYYYDTSTGQWVLVTGTVDWTNDTITVTVSHFTTFAVMAQNAATAPVAINDAAISGVTVPVTGATPVSTIGDNGEYTATVTWSPSGATYAPSTAYTATITITPDSGYTLTGVAANFFTVAGATSVTNFANSGVVTAVFPATTAVSSGVGGGAPVVYTPAVQTEAALSITAVSAVLNGDITSDNGYNITDYGFLWGTSDSSLTNKLDVGTSNLSGAFTATLGNLTAGTTYYFEAYATNSQGTTDGSPMSFTTTGTSTTPTTPTKPAAPAFSDVSTSYWGYNAISSLSSKGIVSGYPDGAFQPDASITRAEFATMLVKALGLNTAGTSGQFTDVTADDWYYGSVNAAVYDGLVSGMGDNLFAPNALITREQMAVMVAKALGTNAPAVDGTELNAFSDSSAVSSWAVSGMEEAVKVGIVSGMTADTLAPMDNATRAQAAAMIYKLLTVLGK